MILNWLSISAASGCSVIHIQWEMVPQSKLAREMQLVMCWFSWMLMASIVRKIFQDCSTKLEAGYDMVVGARDGAGQASRHRGLANGFYNRLASWMVGHAVKDLTSGFRAVRREKFLEFLYLLPNGFSYPTTITMAFFRAGYAVTYEAIDVQPRMQGTESHIRLWRDGIRFLLIIFKIGTLYSPLKLFAPVALAHALVGVGYYAFTFLSSRAPVVGNDLLVECFGYHFSDWSGVGADNATDVQAVGTKAIDGTAGLCQQCRRFHGALPHEE